MKGADLQFILAVVNWHELCESCNDPRRHFNVPVNSYCLHSPFISSQTILTGLR